MEHIGSNAAEPFRVGLDDGSAVTGLHYPAAGAAAATLVLAHGAGAGQRSGFMSGWAGAFAALGVDAVTFDFPYTAQGRKLPDHAPVLEACYRAVVRVVRERVPSAGRRLVIGGKSMGGRMATHIAAQDADLPIAGLVLLGYPLHPPGRPAQRRDAHLPAVRRPMLFVQGSRDAFGTPAELQPVLDRIGPTASLHVVEGGDHSFTVPRAGGRQADVDAAIRERVVAWIGNLQG